MELLQQKDLKLWRWTIVFQMATAKNLSDKFVYWEETRIDSCQSIRTEHKMFIHS
jgi:hypothetical protein